MDAIPQRPLGKTGAKVSALGLGGHHIGDAPTYEEAERIVHEAIDSGITFFDNCWEYHNGKSEVWMGRALASSKKRDRVFLMTKVCTHGRDAKLALQMLDESLRRLQTDHLDLWQIHGVSFDDDPDLAFAKGGVVEALDAAKRAGKVRFVGFTGHKDPAIHLKMLARGYPFDTVQMPLNCVDVGFHTSFEREVVPEARRQGIACLGMKPMTGKAGPIQQKLVTAEEMLRYAMSLPVATTISGMESVDKLRANVAVARGFAPLDASAMEAIRQKVRAQAGDGRFELYKVSLKFDNPQARIPHGFPIDTQQMEVKEQLAEIGEK